MSGHLAVLAGAMCGFPDGGVEGGEPQAAALEQLRRHMERWGEAALLDGDPEVYDDLTPWIDRSFYRFES